MNYLCKLHFSPVTPFKNAINVNLISKANIGHFNNNDIKKKGGRERREETLTLTPAEAEKKKN